MESKVINEKSLTETYVILSELNLYNRLPIELQEFIKNNKDNDYNFTFDKSIPLFEQIQSDTTRNLISYIFIKYINKSKENQKYYEQEIMEILSKFN